MIYFFALKRTKTKQKIHVLISNKKHVSSETPLFTVYAEHTK